MNIWIDVAVIASLFTIGNIVFGHFEHHTPKWRRILKFFIVTGVVALIASTAGHAWSAVFIAASFVLGLAFHFWYLHKHGIDPFTAEPREKYYALRGWPL